jgi:predicted transcriptional regulator
MPPKQQVPRPTYAELEILQILWKRGSGTVRQIHKALSVEKGISSYTTTLKRLQIMLAKGIVLRDESERPQIYRASVTEKHTQRRLMSDFLRRVFAGSARKLVAAMATTNVSREELAEIRELLNKLEEKQP